MKLYIIREKASGATFKRTGQQGSWQVPELGTKYRFWESVRSARSWLTNWCKGEQHWSKITQSIFDNADEAYEHKFIGFKNPRNRDDYEIVECELTIGEVK